MARPVGSRNSPHCVVVQHLAGCPDCGSTSREVEHKLDMGELSSGERLYRRSVRCCACGRRYWLQTSERP